MKKILSLAHPNLLESACRSKADMIRIGPYPGESLQIWGIEEILRGIDLIRKFNKDAQVRVPVIPRSDNKDIKFLVEKLAARPEVELVLGAWHQIPWETPNAKVAGENLNITNSDEVCLLGRWKVEIVTLPPGWSPHEDDFWRNVPGKVRFEYHTDGPVHVGWVCLKGCPDGDLVPSYPYGDSLSLCLKRGQLWSKLPITQDFRKTVPSMIRGIVECWN